MIYQVLQVKPSEVGTNVLAAYVSGGRAHEVPAVMEALSLSASDGFELAFNQACAHLSIGNPQKAEEELLLAQRLGQPCLPYMTHACSMDDDSCASKLGACGSNFDCHAQYACVLV